jgi:homocitrate synthase
VPSPRLSPQTAHDVAALARLGLRAGVVAHVRCVADDVDAALAAGVDGINLFYGTSIHLRTYSHGHDLAYIAGNAAHQVRRIRERELYVRFSAEDAFRTARDELVPIFDEVVAAGACRIGLPDTVGIATPREVEERVAFFAARYPGVGIEFHGHNDTGCAVANALAALEAGADCVDVTVLGIGERNGIASLSGLIAALYPRRRELLERFDLRRLPHIDGYVADLLGIPIPFNNPITSTSAFTHRAGIHTNAVLRAPATYEALDPLSFGLSRRLDTTSRLAGHHAIAARAAELGLRLDEAAARAAGQRIKHLADTRILTQDEVDDILRTACVEGDNTYGHAD